MGKIGEALAVRDDPLDKLQGEFGAASICDMTAYGEEIGFGVAVKDDAVARHNQVGSRRRSRT